MRLTSNRVRRTAWSTGVTVVLGVGLLAAAPTTAASAASDRAASAQRAARSADLSTSSSLAPVRLPGQKMVRSYTPSQIRSLDRTGGDPAVLSYWTDARMKAAKPLDMPGDARLVDRTARAVAQKRPESTTRPVAS